MVTVLFYVGVAAVLVLVARNLYLEWRRKEWDDEDLLLSNGEMRASASRRHNRNG